MYAAKRRYRHPSPITASQGPHSQPTQNPGCKVLRQDYPIKIPGVSLSTSIVNEKSPINEDTIKSICKGIKRLIPTFPLTKIQWLHNLTVQAICNLTVLKTSGTVILGLPTQNMQYQAIKKGVCWLELVTKG
jgi:hypothetical protein